jgi:hypothetical protein
MPISLLATIAMISVKRRRFGQEELQAFNCRLAVVQPASWPLVQ